MNTITRVVKAKRMESAKLLCDPTWHHTHPRRNRDPSPYDLEPMKVPFQRPEDGIEGWDD